MCVFSQIIKLFHLKHRRNHFPFVLYIAGCLAGCLYQIFGFCEIYFNYRTSTETRIFINDSVRYPGVVLCFPYQDIINKSYSNLTIADIFDLSPKAEKALIECNVISTNGRLTKQNTSQCNEIFIPTKYFRGNHLCYRFLVSRKLGFIYSVSRVANALFHSHHVYDLFLATAFASSSRIYIFSYVYAISGAEAYETRALYPYLSQGFGKFIIRRSTLVNMIVFRNQIVEYNLLPKPYDTDCTPRRQDAYFECLKSSLNSSISRYPSQAYTLVPLRIQPLHPDDLINKEILQAVGDANSKCKPLYTKLVCKCYMSSTDLEYFSNSRQQTGLHISAATPLSALMSVTSYPLLYFRDLIYHVSGCVSFWLGLSAMHLNPSKIKHRLLDSKVFSIFRIRLILSSFFIVCCFIGFVIHVNLAAFDYFLYKTSSEISLDQNDTLRYPSLLICFKYYYNPNGSLTYYSHIGSDDSLRLANVKTLLSLSRTPIGLRNSVLVERRVGLVFKN